MNTIIIKPLVTEKSMTDTSRGKYAFVVAKNARKTTIKQAIKQQFGVTVTGVAINNVKGKTKRVGVRRVEVAVSTVKKATVTVKKGEKIGLFEPGGAEEEKETKKKK